MKINDKDINITVDNGDVSQNVTVKKYKIRAYLFVWGTLLFILMLGFIGILQVNSFAQDALQWHLPECTKMRFGKGHIAEIAYSPDGNVLAVASSIGIWLYDAKTEKELDLLIGHTGFVKSISFSPDGKILASAGSDGLILLWDIPQRKHRGILTGDNMSRDYSVAFNPDGKTLAISKGKEIRLFDVKTGIQTQTFKEHTTSVQRIVFSPDGKILAGGGHDNIIHLWHFENSGWQKSHTFTGYMHSGAYKGIAFSPDSKILAAGNLTDSIIRLWDVEAGLELPILNASPDRMINSVAFSPDGKTLASSGQGDIRLWDMETFTETYTLTGHKSGLANSVVFSPDGKTLAHAGELNNTIYLWDLKKKGQLRTITGYTPYMYSFALTQDGKTLAFANADNIIRLWDTEENVQIGTLSTHIKRWGGIMAFSSDGKILASENDDNTISLWDMTSLKRLKMVKSGVKHFTFSPNANILAISSGSVSNTIIRFWDVTHAGVFRTLKGYKDRYVSEFAFCPDGKSLAIVDSKNLHLWDIQTAVARWSQMGHADKIILSIAFSPDGKIIANGNYDRTINIWNATNGNSLQTLDGHTKGVYCLTFSPDGTILASGSEDKTIRLWDVIKGKLIRTLTGHTGTVTHLAFNSDGKILISTGPDGTLLFWELQSTK